MAQITGICKEKISMLNWNQNAGRLCFEIPEARKPIINKEKECTE